MRGGVADDDAVPHCIGDSLADDAVPHAVGFTLADSVGLRSDPGRGRAGDGGGCRVVRCRIDVRCLYLLPARLKDVARNARCKMNGLVEGGVVCFKFGAAYVLSFPPLLRCCASRRTGVVKGGLETQGFVEPYLPVLQCSPP